MFLALRSRILSTADTFLVQPSSPFRSTYGQVYTQLLAYFSVLRIDCLVNLPVVYFFAHFARLYSRLAEKQRPMQKHPLENFTPKSQNCQTKIKPGVIIVCFAPIVSLLFTVSRMQKPRLLQFSANQVCVLNLKVNEKFSLTYERQSLFRTETLSSYGNSCHAA